MRCRRVVHFPDLHARRADTSTLCCFLSLCLRRIFLLTVRILYPVFNSVTSSHFNDKFAQCSVVDSPLPYTFLLLIYSSLAAFVFASLAFTSSVILSHLIALPTLGQIAATTSRLTILLPPTSCFNFDYFVLRCRAGPCSCYVLSLLSNSSLLLCVTFSVAVARCLTLLFLMRRLIYNKTHCYLRRAAFSVNAAVAVVQFLIVEPCPPL